MAVTCFCFVRADKVALVLYFSAPHTHSNSEKCGLKESTKKNSNATLAVQPSQEMPVETVCAGNSYKGRERREEKPSRPGFLEPMCSFFLSSSSGLFGCLFMLLPRPHTLQMSFMRVCQPPTMPESHLFSSEEETCKGSVAMTEARFSNRASTP